MEMFAKYFTEELGSSSPTASIYFSFVQQTLEEKFSTNS